MKTHFSICCALGALIIGSASAGPVTTVPWNGHTGAVSYTYDDARPSQLTTVLPKLNSMGVKATFFICLTSCGSSFEANNNKNTWIQASQNGHELGNHTKNHTVLKGDFATASSATKDMAGYLRALDPSVEAVTFAYPECGSSTEGQRGVETENFIARSCGSTDYGWNNKPYNWMDVQGMIVQTSNPDNRDAAIQFVGKAKTNNSWVTIIIHGVNAEDIYSPAAPFNDNVLKAGVDNKLWIDTYKNVGAYYRAHFTMDAVQAQANGNGWKMSWTSPHPKMPKSVKLRVNLDGSFFGNDISVSQNGTSITKEADGSYIIDFMKLSLDVQKGGVSSSALPTSSSQNAVSSSSAWVWPPLSSATVGIAQSQFPVQAAMLYRVYDLMGSLHYTMGEFPNHLPQGKWIVKAFDSFGNAQYNKVLDVK